MGWLKAAVLWVYDFLAEDFTLLAGTIVAVLVAAVAAHAVPNAAGYILWAVVILVIALSLWRTVAATR